MADRDRILVVGASLAGLRGAEALRRHGHAGPITLVGDEPYPPYDRPPLSKRVLTGEARADRIALPSRPGLDLTWRLGTAAVGLDLAAREVALATGERLPFDRLLIATGTRARPWPNAAEAALAGVHSVRNRDDSERLRGALAAAPRRVLIIGAGFIGCEAASACRSIGLPVTLADPNPTPLASVLGTRIGAAVAAMLREAGVDYRPSTRVEALESDGEGRVRGARLVGGGTVAAPVVIVALGALRNTEWLAGSGLAADAGGVACDGQCRVLDRDGRAVEGIAAAGDVARFPHPLFEDGPVALEHWGHAVAQAEHAARTLLGQAGAPYAEIPAFWSSQFDVNIKSVGLTNGADSVAVTQGDFGARRFVAVYGRNGRTVAAVSFDQTRWLPAYAGRIEARAAFPPILGATDQGRVAPADPGFPASPARG
ncbi:cyclic nucleotide-binding protein [Methylobacterium sp. 4-46]|uniref:NAD(P)/FAD-dependent oxidoreductase n=1 Tax=unclassified Methylobacterium TaxID=2615210 RepID=UPI000152DAD8|nr:MULTISPECIES: FAD/NAD(P)-binding oxidoreductase [Methylobacterium]ACA18940.1 cyclic nucleotide-binding protein [Methylobacterium sp. 4-46]WFT78163.1 FAD/NAD(P)-binding oxidoreductase [Methylobacterium nodulans]